MYPLIVILEETTWRTILDVSVAAGTIGAAAAAWWAARAANRIAKADRRDANLRAEQDRADRDEREQRERRDDNLRYRLERLTAVAEAFEVYNIADPKTFGSIRNARAGLRAALGASPDLLPAARAVVGDGEFTLAVINDVYQNYRELLPTNVQDKTPAELLALGPNPVARAAIYGTIRAARRELLGEQNPELAVRDFSLRKRLDASQR